MLNPAKSNKKKMMKKENEKKTTDFRFRFSNDSNFHTQLHILKPK